MIMGNGKYKSVNGSISLLFCDSSSNNNVGNTCTEHNVGAFTDSCLIILKTVTHMEKVY